MTNRDLLSQQNQLHGQMSSTNDVDWNDKFYFKLSFLTDQWTKQTMSFRL